MHTAAATDNNQTFETVLTARATLAQLQSVWAEMSEVDALSSPGPTRAMSVTLSNGQRASVVFHERKDIIEILATPNGSVETGLADLLAVLKISPEAILWTHANVGRRVLVGSPE
jgi:hypothetical protein